MHTIRPARRRALLAAAILVAACTPAATPGPTDPGPSGAPSAAPTEAPSPTPAPVAFPLAVVTGFTTLRSVVSLEEVAQLAAAGTLVVPCDLTVTAPAIAPTAPCVAADEIVDAIAADPETVALLPPGLVEPATKVLPIAGDGPYGLFGPDLFGDAAARSQPYPVQAEAAPGALDEAWTAYDAAKVWTMTDVGSLCADRGAAKAAVTLGKGWDWVFEGGTARYTRAPYVNPAPPPGVSTELIVKAEDTGNDGASARIIRGADVAIADHECPIMPDAQWTPNTGSRLVFSVPEAVLPRWRDILGIDIAYLAANHMSDRGVAGIRSTLKLLDQYGFARTGLGMNLDEGLEPAYTTVAGVKVGVVAWNDVGGVARADADTAGVPWITKANVDEAVRRAREGGAQVVVCAPQWWGGAEYHDDLKAKQVTQLGWFEGAGCDHVIGAGTHVAGPVLFRPGENGVRLVVASPGNFMFGQAWWQQVQEGVIVEQKYVGTKMVNLRLHPYVMLLQARAGLLDPLTDGHYVLERIFAGGSFDYR